MAKKTYIGVNGVAKNVKNVYIGINGVAKKIKKMYVGVNGVAKECYSAISIPKWSTGTDAQIVNAVQMADRGEVNLADYWSVGDERTVSLSAMSATGVSESHSAQNVVLVLSHVGGKTLTTATTSGRTTCSFQVDMKQCLNEKGYINNTATNSGGWSSSARRTWCNNVFKNAIPSTLSSIFKQHKNMTSAGNQSSTIDTTDDWFALRSEVEVVGTYQKSYSGEGGQITYYQTSSNRIKSVNGTSGSWRLRSPYNANVKEFIIMSSGSSGHSQANTFSGISPFGCI